MDALAALWFTSIVGAAGFTATGYFLARSRMPRVATVPTGADEIDDAEPRASKRPTAPPEPQPRAESVRPPAVEPTPRVSARVAPKVSDRPHDPRREDDDPLQASANEVDVLDPQLQKAKKTDAMIPPAAPAADTIDLEHLVDALRVELRAEVVARHTVEARAKDLEARLSTMSQQVAALRARGAQDASAVRRDSMMRGASLAPGANTDVRSRLSTRAPGLFAEIDELKAEIAKLTNENESLRAAALGAPPPAPRASGPRSDLIVPDVLKRMVERIARIENVRAAAVVETNGLVLASSGERSEALAAFGNYIRDAASRSTRLLPLGTAEEVLVRDVHGVVFSSRILGRPEAELALVTLAFSQIPGAELAEIIAQTPGLGPASTTVRPHR
jgi:predicted regulator of Ras-like GTPase activity (Roadblock/LC7/MglB family)